MNQDQGKRMVNALVSQELWQEAKRMGIKFRVAFETGMRVLAKYGLAGPDAHIAQIRADYEEKIASLSKMLDQKCRELERIEEVIKFKPPQ